MSRLTKSSSSSILRNACADDNNGPAEATLRRATSLKPSRSANFKDFKGFDLFLTKFRRPAPKPEVPAEDPPLATVAEEHARPKRLQLGEGVKALLAARRKHTTLDDTVSPIKRLKRSLSARLLGDQTAKNERQYRSFAIKNHGAEAPGSMTSSPWVFSRRFLPIFLFSRRNSLSEDYFWDLGKYKRNNIDKGVYYPEKVQKDALLIDWGMTAESQQMSPHWDSRTPIVSLKYRLWRC